MYTGLLAEMARNKHNSRTLTKALNERGYKISYDRLRRQVHGDMDFPLMEARLICDILHSDMQTVFGV